MIGAAGQGRSWKGEIIEMIDRLLCEKVLAAAAATGADYAELFCERTLDHTVTRVDR